MNKLARFVKNRMLAYPGSCPSRMHVLLHAYLCSGNGVSWTAEGTLFDSDDRERRKIDRNDDAANHRIDMLHQMRDRIAEHVSEDDANVWYQAALNQAVEDHARRQIELDHVEQNIKMLASTVDDTIILKYGVDNTTMLTNPYSRGNPVYYGGHYEEPGTIIRHLLGMFPVTIAKMPERVESSFFDGAIEVLDVILRSIPDSDEKATLLDYRATLFAVHERY